MTTEERFEMLEKKLARAEHRSRVMLVAVVMTVVGVLLLGASGDEVQKVLCAQEFRLVDQNGKTLAALEMRENGPGLAILDQSGNDRAVLAVSSDGIPALGLMDKDGKPRVRLCLDPTGLAALELRDQNGKSNVQVGSLVAADSTVEAGLTLFGQNGMPVAGLTASPLGACGLALCDLAGKPHAVLGLVESGQPMLSLSDQNDNPRALLGLHESGRPSLKLLDQTGNTIWQAP